MNLTIFDKLVPRDRVDSAGAVGDRLVLPFERRQIARQRVVLASGREAGIVLPRGTVLRGGDVLRSRDGGSAAVVAAAEDVSTVVCDDPRELARVAYHLGNRHVTLEVGDGWVRYVRDHVLDGMVRGLGGAVAHESAPFEPEAGAYAQHGHAHRHEHGHGQGHAHRHEHEHEHEHEHGHSDGHRHGPLHEHAHGHRHEHDGQGHIHGGAAGARGRSGHEH